MWSISTQTPVMGLIMLGFLSLKVWSTRTTNQTNPINPRQARAKKPIRAHTSHHHSFVSVKFSSRWSRRSVLSLETSTMHGIMYIHNIYNIHSILYIYISLYIYIIIYISLYIYIWLVVSTILKNISQIGSSSQLSGGEKHVPNHQPV